LKLIQYNLINKILQIDKLLKYFTKIGYCDIWPGYLNDEEGTNIIIDKGGWLHTGDIGYINDNDELFIIDRLKELIKYKGFQVAPAELEAMLIAHPNISDAAIVS